MGIVHWLLIGAAWLRVPAALAHGPTPQKVVETVEIAAPIGRVWQAVADFGAIASWNPALKASTGAGGNQPGGKRLLTFGNGEQLEEQLDSYDPTQYEYSYRMTRPNVAALPASSYSAVLRLTPLGERTRVEWKSRLYRGDTGNEPPEHLSDEAAVRAMTGFFRAGLDQLKTTLERAP
ncbi:SRPBCC family protein [Candidatus Methylocalor cossyra]|uniref:MxaD protein n=1 Tax=Candidatus Methylocalor cossyra TaxID=3108543 RepID=A0ABM9NDX2_9GAMM